MSDNGDRTSPEQPPDLTSREVVEEMTVLEPYTTGELADRYAVTKQRIATLLERLFEDGTIRKKQLGSDQAIWIREAPVHECANCGYTYEVKYLHPVFSSVRFCPQCGTRL